MAVLFIWVLCLAFSYFYARKSFFKRHERCFYCIFSLSMALFVYLKIEGFYKQSFILMQGCCLLLLSLYDAKEKAVPTNLLVGFVGLNLLSIMNGELCLSERLFGCSFVLPFLALFKYYPECMGEGDLYCIASLGFAYGAYSLCICLTFSYLSATLYSLVLLARQKAQRQTAIAMFPFFTIGFVLFIALFA